jgi:hypothetical protein
MTSTSTVAPNEPLPMVDRIARTARATRLLAVALLCLIALRPAPAHADPPPSPHHSAPAWVAPLAGPVVVRRGFDPPAERWDAGHRGVDLAGRPGAAVYAPAAGTVTYAGLLAGRGVLVVSHGAVRTTYEPVLPLLPTGTEVDAGDLVALLLPGHHGPALPGESLLHWGLLRGETYLDPLLLLRRGPSRLLPVAPVPPGPPGRAPGPQAAPPVLPAAVAPAVPPTLPPVLPPGALSGPPTPPPGQDRPSGPTPSGRAAAGALGAVLLGTAGAVSRAGRRASRGAGGPPSCASGRCGSRSRPGPGRSPPG